MTDSTENQNKKASSDEADLNYWVGRWQANKLGFHRVELGRLFETNLLPKLIGSKRPKYVLFSLCGKTIEMKAVLDNGHRVIGIEGSPVAVEAFFNENQIPYAIEKDETNQYQIYKGTEHPITIYCGDFLSFNLTLPAIDYIWDRGGLVAISPSTREQYRDTLLRLMTPSRTRLFLVAIDYTDPEFSGPPFVVSDADINNLFGSECSTELVQVRDETDEFNARAVARPVKYIEERLHLIIKNEK